MLYYSCKVSKSQNFKVPKFQSLKVSKFPSSKKKVSEISKFQVSKVPEVQAFQVYKAQRFNNHTYQKWFVSFKCLKTFGRCESTNKGSQGLSCSTSTNPAIVVLIAFLVSNSWNLSARKRNTIATVHVSISSSGFIFFAAVKLP